MIISDFKMLNNNGGLTFNTQGFSKHIYQQSFQNKMSNNINENGLENQVIIGQKHYFHP